MSDEIIEKLASDLWDSKAYSKFLEEKLNQKIVELAVLENHAENLAQALELKESLGHPSCALAAYNYYKQKEQVLKQ